MSRYYEPTAEGTWCITETRDGMENQSNKKEKQDTSIQDLSSTVPSCYMAVKHGTSLKVLNINRTVSNASARDGYWELDGNKELQTREWLKWQRSMTSAARYDKEVGTGWDTYSGQRVRTTASQHCDGHQKVKEREGGQRQIGEGRWRRKKARQGGRAGK